MSWVPGKSAAFISNDGVRSANVPPASGREISTRVTLKVLAPMDKVVPIRPPRAAINFDSGQTSPGAGIPWPGVPAAKGSFPTSTCGPAAGNRSSRRVRW